MRFTNFLASFSTYESCGEPDPVLPLEASEFALECNKVVTPLGSADVAVIMLLFDEEPPPLLDVPDPEVARVAPEPGVLALPLPLPACLKEPPAAATPPQRLP